MATVTGTQIGDLGFGLMGLTWRPTVTPDEQAFATINKAIELGANFLNSGEFYGQPSQPTANLDLLKRFFEKYPEQAEKTVISVKGGIDSKTWLPDGSPEGVRKSVENSIKHLGNVKKLDLFECARVDKNVPIETTVAALGELVKEGLIGGISLSEVKPETIERAAKVHKIEAVEVEFSLFSLEAKDLGVLDTAAKLGIPVIAYSPLGRGFLTGQIKDRSQIPEGDIRLFFERFSEENFPLNLVLVEKIEELAKAKGVTVAQFAIAWIKKHEDVISGLKIIPIPGATTVSRVEENLAAIHSLTDEEFAQVNEILSKVEVKGGRYNKHAESHLWG
ncbi:NADP-dependent oxidoreductase domain-containing protein [Lipomyces japonicus]|uniref:NADP-dependent oxidoreductase domain-containing protein n=1 Tax=Lipomyces japonicus TaxID=56871 RepID=UPI0034CD400F